MSGFADHLPPHWQTFIRREALRRSGGKYETFSATEFNGHIQVHHADGSRARFEHAFAVIDRTRDEVAIFTEHCGYHVFAMGSIDNIEGECR